MRILKTGSITTFYDDFSSSLIQNPLFSLPLSYELFRCYDSDNCTTYSI